jgi:hypothetical protein
MAGDSERKNAFPALRLRSEGLAGAEIFMAIVLDITCKGLPACMVADGQPIAAHISANEIARLLGPPSHYYLGSSDPCWLLSADVFAGLQGACAPGHLAAASSLSRAFPDQWQNGGGMLSRHLDL